ncbi:MAG: hypothetical protein ABW022_20210, partial [Actinoplanes sp.]
MSEMSDMLGFLASLSFDERATPKAEIDVAAVGDSVYAALSADGEFAGWLQVDPGEVTFAYDLETTSITIRLHNGQMFHVMVAEDCQRCNGACRGGHGGGGGGGG